MLHVSRVSVIAYARRFTSSFPPSLPLWWKEALEITISKFTPVRHTEVPVCMLSADNEGSQKHMGHPFAQSSSGNLSQLNSPEPAWLQVTRGTRNIPMVRREVWKAISQRLSPFSLKPPAPNTLLWVKNTVLKLKILQDSIAWLVSGSKTKPS